MSKRLVLAGAGHAHMELLYRAAEEGMAGVDICMISPSEYHYYSGRLTGFTEGLYSIDDTRIDMKELAKRAGAHFIKKTVKKVHPDQHKVICEDGSVYPFDVISFDIGSLSHPEERQREFVKSIKPIHHFPSAIEDIRRNSHPLIVGGGAAGTEMALSIQAFKDRHALPGKVRLVSSGPLLAKAPKRVSKRMRSLLARKRIEVWEKEIVETISDTHVQTDRGNKIRHTGVLWLGGAQAHPLFRNSGILTDERGFPTARSTLQFENYDYMFGAGDCVTLLNHPELEKSGVHAVKQGPILWNNIKNYLKGGELIEYQPQKVSLHILSTGNKRGFMIYGPVNNHSHRAWKMKHKIDEEFLQKYK